MTNLPLPRQFKLVPMTEAHAEQICTWKYEPPYDIYNSDDWDTMREQNFEFADPDIRNQQYASALDDNGALCGFVQLFPLTGITRIGLGLRPDLCGKRLGQHLVHAAVEEAKRRAPSNLIDLEVLVWNERAYRLYERCGFRYEQTYERMTPTGPAEFHCMTYSDAGSASGP